jgi:hypothetical protein
MNTESEKSIWIHIGSPTMKLMGEFYPPQNWVGSRLLLRVLKQALTNSGVLVTSDGGRGIGMQGELNDCIIAAWVNDASTAVEVIKRELKDLDLLHGCQIGVGDETGLRCVHPSPGVRMAWLVDTERSEMATAELFRAARENLKLLTSVIRGGC